MQWSFVSSNLKLADMGNMESFVVGDINNDGFNDLVLAVASSIDVSVGQYDIVPVVLLNKGDGSFYEGNSEVFSSTPIAQEWVNDTLIYDFNGDGKNDILYIDHGRETGSPPYPGFFNTLYLSSESGLINSTLGIQQEQSFWHGAQNVADIDGDGDLDFAVAALDAEIVDIFVNDGTGGFSNESSVRLPDYVTQWQTSGSAKPLGAGTVAFLDANGDGYKDLITAPYSNTSPDFSEASNFHILLNNGSGNFKSSTIVLDARPDGLSDFYGYESIQVADFDGNGFDDFIGVAEVNTGISSEEPGKGSFVTYYRQTSAGVFEDVTLQSFAGRFIPATNYDKDNQKNHALNELFLGDVDGDGDLDLMQPYFHGQSADISSAIFVNNNGVFSPFVENTSFSTAEANLVASYPDSNSGSARTMMGDVNADGVADIVLLSAVYNTVARSDTNPYGLSYTIDVFASQFGVFHPTNGDDSFTLTSGNDTIDGGAGTDTAIYAGDAKHFSITINKGGAVNVQDRSGAEGTDSLISIEKIDFQTGAKDVNLDVLDGVVNVSSADLSAFIEMYIAYFNRAPDAEGLFYWGTRLSEGMSKNQIAESFYVQPETKALYTNPDDTSGFVTAVYQNFLGRAPDTEGFNYWVKQLDDGVVSKPIFLLAIINGAKAATGSQTDVDYFTNKANIGAYYSVIKGLSNVDNGKAAMALYDGTAGSITAAKNAIDGYYNAALDANNGELLINLVGVMDDPFALV
ncbi:FG-GAP-like repeat-containing protein [Maritalea porphyrae]|uniref:FG-GAP-like repeat-containing protein n=1 Tax=Maritalea porphyrae TaxID=880732 RepID=UPI0022B02E71|nr:FG-GAP-like repeat-containing protein [Maritalea porphyrae]MCZ4274178.1 FG-GAP-like repeat-containing protein [Maritalea porphyrae]